MYQCSESDVERVLSAVDKNKHVPVVANGQCVRLIQAWCGAPAPASSWKQGEKVKGATSLRQGTAIATFIDGNYPNHSHGNHAAIYVSQSVRGIVVIDQWAGAKGLERGINTREILFRGHGVASNDGDTYYVVE